MSVVWQGVRDRQVRILESESYLRRLQGQIEKAGRAIGRIPSACIERCCGHPETIRRTLNGKLYLECIDCGHKSKGIQT